MRALRSALTAAAIVAAAASPAAAQSFTAWQSQSFPLQTTNFGTLTPPGPAQFGNFQQFNPNLGTLLFVEFLLRGDVSGIVRFESLDAAPATVTANLQATVSLFSFTGQNVVTTLPVVTLVKNVAAFDGNINFADASGFNSGTVTASDTKTGVQNTNLAGFIGTGTYQLGLSAAGQSAATGAGNLISQFNTEAGALAEVRYAYTPAPSVVPEPSTYALMGSGLLALGGIAARRRRA